MPFCPECGKSVGPSQKFCRSCGASLLEESPAAAAAPPAPPTGPACQSCGAPLAPDEKFCGNCGARAGGAPAPAPAYQPPPAAPPVYAPPPPAAPAYQPPPAPVYHAPPPPPPQYATPAPVTTGQVCKACGNPIKPGDKFCSKCLVKVPDSPAPAPAAYAPPPPAAPAYQPPPAAPAQGGYTCSSCGSPVSGTEKFCGICGAPVVAVKPPEPAAPPAGKFCGSCGAAISTTTRFCGVCGAAITPSSSGGGDTSFRAGPPVATGGEEVTGVIANTRVSKFLGASWDTWNIVITNRRMIMVRMTSEMLNAAVAEAQARAKAEGKGFFGIMKDQLSATFGYARRYETMHPDQALAETPGNFAIENARISAIRLKVRTSGSDNAEYTEFRLIIESPDGKHEYLMAEDDRYVSLLKMVYGDRVHMPFGYFRVGGARIRFF